MPKTTILYYLSRLSFALFLLYVIILPFEKRHFFEFGMVRLISGFNEWLTVSLYASDIVLLALIALVLVQFTIRIITKTPRPAKLDKVLLFAAIALIGLSIATVFLPEVYIKTIAWYRVAVLTGALFLFFYTTAIRSTYKIAATLGVLLISGAFQAILALFQFTLQRSLGLKILGEIDTSPFIFNVPKIVIDNTRIIRSVGTFPHANLLGMFLVIATVAGMLLTILLYKKRKNSQKSTTLTLFGTKKTALTLPLTSGVLSVAYFGTLFCTLLSTVGVFLSFSRTALASLIIAWALLLLFGLAKTLKGKIKSKQILYPIGTLLLATVILGMIFLPFFTNRMTLGDSNGDMALSQRQFLTDVSYDFITYSPFVGIGMGNFIYTMSIYYFGLEDWVYQPVHNLYLLITAEIGLMGLGILLIILLRVVKRLYIAIQKKGKITLPMLFSIILGSILIFAGFFDHYFWSIRQGIMLFWLTLGIVFVLPYIKKQPRR
ncbi:O-antigen ligase family protein [Patescibacteria group bacterium]|nr:O-antigen ligase family protein [Patescibacteria group bacterium]